MMQPADSHLGREYRNVKMRLQSRVTVEVVSWKRIFVPQVVNFLDGLTNPNRLLVL